MPDFPPQVSTIEPAGAIHAGGLSSMLADVMVCNANTWNLAAVAQNRATYLAFFLEKPVTVYQIAWENGATVNGNVDVGIYDEVGTRLVSSGSTLQAGASVIQVVDITNTVLSPGAYFMAHASDSATATFMRAGVSNEQMRIAGIQWEAAAFPLPATATMSTIASSFGIVLSLLLRPEA